MVLLTNAFQLGDHFHETPNNTISYYQFVKIGYADLECYAPAWADKEMDYIAFGWPQVGSLVSREIRMRLILDLDKPLATAKHWDQTLYCG
jgi:hypothetical protein